MNALDEFFQIVQTQLTAIHQTQRQQIERAADYVANALVQDKFIYVFGSGHSHTLSEEMFYRAGGLARVVAILDENLMVHKSATGSTDWERKEGYAAEVLSRYNMGQGDVLLIVSNSGRNAVPIEMAMEGVKRGATVIAISSAKYSGAFSSRHSSGKKLSEVAHLVIDNCGLVGDAVMELPGLPQKTGPTSSISSAFILHSISVEAVKLVLARGGKPEVWGSANSDSTNNEALLKKYKGVVPHL